MHQSETKLGPKVWFDLMNVYKAHTSKLDKQYLLERKPEDEKCPHTRWCSHKHGVKAFLIYWFDLQPWEMKIKQSNDLFCLSLIFLQINYENVKTRQISIYLIICQK